MITLSKRLEAIASLITPGYIVADVGTDHGYIPIYQVQQNRSPSAIAMDLRKGPLQRAADHIQSCGLSDRIKTRLSDGTAALGVGEAEAIVVAGMGGELVLHILTDGEAVCRSAKELILQPQSEIAGVRRYLREHAYRIVAENMIYEDGKYYPMMRVVPVAENEPQQDAGMPVVGNESRDVEMSVAGNEPRAAVIPASGSELRAVEMVASGNGTLDAGMPVSGSYACDVELPVAENEPCDVEMTASGNMTCVESPTGSEMLGLYDLYGELLLKEKHPVLRQYLVYQENLLNDILDGLRRQPDTDKIRIRIGEIEKKLNDNRMAQHMLQ
jgi:tRNA A22 N-methylase